MAGKSGRTATSCDSWFSPPPASTASSYSIRSPIDQVLHSSALLSGERSDYPAGYPPFSILNLSVASSIFSWRAPRSTMNGPSCMAGCGSMTAHWTSWSIGWRISGWPSSSATTSPKIRWECLKKRMPYLLIWFIKKYFFSGLWRWKILFKISRDNYFYFWTSFHVFFTSSGCCPAKLGSAGIFL